MSTNETKKKKKGKIIKEELKRIEKVGKSALMKLGFICFLVGVITTLIVGLILGYKPELRTENTWGYVASLLTLLGFLIGIVNLLGYSAIPTYRINKFLMAVVALVVIGVGTQGLEGVPVVGPYLAGIALFMILLFAPAAVTLALRVRMDQRTVFSRGID